MLHKSEIIAAVHRSGHQAVVVVTGGGSLAISDLLTVPGASAFLLEAVVPYASTALAQWLGRSPESFCARETVLAMATVAFRRGRQLGGESSKLIGVGCTASLVSDRPKLGEHRVWIALQTAQRTDVVEYQLKKGLRDRSQEERLVGDLLLDQIVEACGVNWNGEGMTDASCDSGLNERSAHHAERDGYVAASPDDLFQANPQVYPGDSAAGDMVLIPAGGKNSRMPPFVLSGPTANHIKRLWM